MRYLRRRIRSCARGPPEMLIRFSPSARREFLDFIAHVHNDRPMAALRFRERAEKVLRRLETFPSSGRKIPEFPHLPHREVIVRPLRFFYRVAGETVWIVAVWHGAQIPREPGEPS